MPEMANAQNKNRGPKFSSSTLVKANGSLPIAPPSPSAINEMAMDKMLDSLGLWRKPIAKDGSCLFRAVAEEVYNSQSVHLSVRRECIDYMRSNEKAYSDFVEEPFDHYLYKLQNPKEWGGEVEIVALSKLYNVDFDVHQSVNPEPIHVTSNGSPKLIRLCFLNGNHYDIVYPKSFKDSAIFVQALLEDVVDQFWELSSESHTQINGNGAVDHGAPMARSLSGDYRNVELEAYDAAKQEQQLTDHRLAEKLQLAVKDECGVLLREHGINGGTHHKAFIEEIVSEGEIYKVFVEDLQRSFPVAFDDIDLLPDSSYRNLSGYYRKEDVKEENYKTPGRKRRTGRGRNAKGKQDARYEVNNDGRETKNNIGSNDKNGSARGRRSDTKKNQASVASQAAKQAAQSQPSGDVMNDKEDAVVSDVDCKPAEKSTATPPSNLTPLVRGTLKENGESSSAFWGKLNLTTVNDVTSNSAVANELESPVAPSPNPVSKETRVHTCAMMKDAASSDDVAGVVGITSSPITTATPESVSIPLSSTRTADKATTKSDAAHMKSKARRPVKDANVTEAPINADVQSSMKAPATSSVPPLSKAPVTHVLTGGKNGKEQGMHLLKAANDPVKVKDSTGQPTSSLPEDSQSGNQTATVPTSKKQSNNPGGNRRNNRAKGASIKNDHGDPVRILTKNNSSNFASEKQGKDEKKERKMVTFDKSLSSDPPCMNDAPIMPLERCAPELSNEIDPNHYHPSSSHMTAADMHQLPPQSTYSDHKPQPHSGSMPLSEQPSRMICPSPFGYVSLSCDPSGKDLPSNIHCLQWFFNLGVQYFQQQQQQYHQQMEHLLSSAAAAPSVSQPQHGGAYTGHTGSTPYYSVASDFYFANNVMYNSGIPHNQTPGDHLPRNFNRDGQSKRF